MPYGSDILGDSIGTRDLLRRGALNLRRLSLPPGGLLIAGEPLFTGIGPLIVQNHDVDSADPFRLEVLRLAAGDSVAGADDDQSYMTFYMDDSAGTQVEFGRIQVTARDVTASSKDSAMTFKVYNNSSATTPNIDGLILDGGSNLRAVFAAGWTVDLDGGNVILSADGSRLKVAGLTTVSIHDQTPTKHITFSSDAATESVITSFTGDIRINGNDILDSDATTRITLNAATFPFKVLGAARFDGTLLTDGALTANGILSGIVAGAAFGAQNTTDAVSNSVATFSSGNRATPADNDEGFIRFRNDDSDGFQQEFSRLTWKALDVTSTTKDSQLEFACMVNNTLTDILSLASTGATVNSGDLIIATAGDDLFFEANSGSSKINMNANTFGDKWYFAKQDIKMSMDDTSKSWLTGIGGSTGLRRFKWQNTRVGGIVGSLLELNENNTDDDGQDGGAVINEDGLDYNFRVEGDTDVSLIHTDAGNDTVGIGENPGTAAKLSIDQSSATGAKPVLKLDQADVSEELIRFTGTAASADVTQSIVDDGDVATATLAGWVKVFVEDDGSQITNQAYFQPLYTLT